MDPVLDRNTLTSRSVSSRRYGGEMDVSNRVTGDLAPPSQRVPSQRVPSQRVSDTPQELPQQFTQEELAGDMVIPGKEKISTSSIISLVIGSVALLAFLIFIAWYFGSGKSRKGTEDSVKEIVKNSSDISPTFKSLAVRDDTELGTSLSDKLTVEAGVNSNFVPYEDKKQNLGSASRSWDNLYIDQIVYDNGVSVVASGNDIYISKGGLGFTKPKTSYSIEAGDIDTIGVSQSGYSIVLSQDSGASPDGYTLQLPPSTGSGVFYDVVFGTSACQTDDQVMIIKSTDIFSGIIYVLEENSSISGVGDPDRVAFFNPSTTSSGVITINNTRPVNKTDGTQGVRKGSSVRFTDYKNGEWLVDGKLFTSNGVSAGEINNPFG